MIDEPTRRLLYEYVVGARGPVGRDEASAAVGVTRPTAAFHLDRLADDAMLQTRLLGNNPRELTRADARAIYAAAL